MTVAPRFKIVTDMEAGSGLVYVSPNNSDKWVWTAKLMHDWEVEDSWKSDGEFDSPGRAIADCYSHLRSLDFEPRGAVEV